MGTPPKVQVLETYREVPILEVSYTEPTLLTREAHREQIQALLDLPYPRFVTVISFANLSYAKDYTPMDQAEDYQSPLFQQYRERVITVIRYHAGSLTSMIQTMSAHTLVRASASNFAPDLTAALRAARRAVDGALVQQV
jgi:hypothetical protein